VKCSATKLDTSCSSRSFSDAESFSFPGLGSLTQTPRAIPLSLLASTLDGKHPDGAAPLPDKPDIALAVGIVGAVAGPIGLRSSDLAVRESRPNSPMVWAAALRRSSVLNLSSGETGSVPTKNETSRKG
jgi:hypothetical protein